MTALVRIEPITLEPVSYRAWSYVMTEADLERMAEEGRIASGSWIEQRERTVAHVHYAFTGMRETIPLGVPLCSGCDSEIIDHQCSDCGLIFTGEPA